MGRDYGSARVGKSCKIVCARKKAAPQEDSYDGITWEQARQYCKKTYWGYDYVSVQRRFGQWQCVVYWLRTVPPHALKKT